MLDLQVNEFPKVSQFILAGVLQQKNLRGEMKPAIVNCPARLFKKVRDKFEVVGRILIDKEFSTTSTYCHWDYLIDVPNRYFFDKENHSYIGEPTLTVQQLIAKENVFIKAIKRIF